MSGNSFGRLFTYTSFGESHGEALGVILDGFPSRIKVDGELLSSMLKRRSPGQSALTTPRKEKDEYHILSGVYEGYTTGAPIAVVVYNENQKSRDYSSLEHVFRPGHADYTYYEKYGIRDHRGGGRSSGRETVARVIAGAFAEMALQKYGISVDAGVVGVGKINPTGYGWNPPFSSPLYSPVNGEELTAMTDEIEDARRSGDSVGAVVECRVRGVPAGLGEPAFDKLDALFSHAMFSIGAVKGFEIGRGCGVSRLRGSDNNDPFRIDEDGNLSYGSNNAGGILGGISTGAEIVMKTYFKPTPSIALEQDTVTDTKENTKIRIEGRHDPCIGPRAVVVVEAMAASVILDSLLIFRAYEDGKRE